jgi:hypothetical protein
MKHSSDDGKKCPLSAAALSACLGWSSWRLSALESALVELRQLQLGVASRPSQRRLK